MFESEALVATWAVVFGTWLCVPVDVGNAFGLGYRCSYAKRQAILLEHLSLRRRAIVPDKDRGQKI